MTKRQEYEKRRREKIGRVARCVALAGPRKLHRCTQSAIAGGDLCGAHSKCARVIRVGAP